MVEADLSCVYKEFLEGVIPRFAYRWVLRGWNRVEVVGAFVDLASSVPSHPAAGPDDHPMGVYKYRGGTLAVVDSNHRTNAGARSKHGAWEAISGRGVVGVLWLAVNGRWEAVGSQEVGVG